MTVVCYKAPYMASDGRITEENTIFTNMAQKIYKLKGGGLVGSAGDADDRDLVNLLNRIKTDIPTHKQLITLGFEFAAILALPNGSVWVLESARIEDTDKYKAAIFEIKESFIAVGSGSSWAMGAMDRGATAEQGVKTAIKFDNNCGGKVQVVKLESKDIG